MNLTICLSLTSAPSGIFDVNVTFNLGPSPVDIPIIGESFVSADVPVTQGAITVVMNPNKVGTDDSTGIYYNWNASVQVTDLDGRPVANQKVTMDIRATEFVRGQWVVLTDPVTNEKYWSQKHLNNPPAYSPLSCAVPTIDDPSTPYDDTKVTITDDVDSNGKDIQVEEQR